MKILSTPTFAKQIKKLHSNQKKDLDLAIIDLASKPDLGSLKKGDLLGVRVYKFNMVGQLVLLAYEWQEVDQQIVLLSLGSHENFYRDLKR